MVQAEFSPRERRQLLLFGWVIVGAIAFAGALGAATARQRWITLVLVLAFGVLIALRPVRRMPIWSAHAYLAIETGLVALLMYLHDNWSLFTVLGSLVCVQVLLLLPLRPGIPWIVGMAAITGAYSLAKWDWPGSLVLALCYAGAYAFFAVFGRALVVAETARRESMRLLAELQEAHQKLQEYAGRVEELAAVEERNRLAREMHDTLGHRLTVAAVQLEAAQRLCSIEPERSKAMIGTVREEVREALAELRTTVTALRAPLEEDLQLRTSLRRLVSHFQDATGLTVHQVLPEELPDLPNSHRLALYRAAQEALTNVQRHAEARQVWLVLNIADSGISLLVSDDGRGMTLTAERESFGLAGLRERAEKLGGNLYLEPRRGGGTQLTFRLPLGERTVEKGGASTGLGVVVGQGSTHPDPDRR
jgi:signal transduction histidine kinase